MGTKSRNESVLAECAGEREREKMSRWEAQLLPSLLLASASRVRFCPSALVLLQEIRYCCFPDFTKLSYIKLYTTLPPSLFPPFTLHHPLPAPYITGHPSPSFNASNSSTSLFLRLSFSSTGMNAF
jgi:hypothetical protein